MPDPYTTPSEPPIPEPEERAWSSRKLAIWTFSPVVLLVGNSWLIESLCKGHDGITWLLLNMLFTAIIALFAAVETGVHFSRMNKGGGAQYAGSIALWFLAHCFLYFGVGFFGCSLLSKLKF